MAGYDQGKDMVWTRRLPWGIRISTYVLVSGKKHFSGVVFALLAIPSKKAVRFLWRTEAAHIHTEDPAMDQVVQPVNNAIKNTVEVVVHIQEELGEEQRKSLVSALEHDDGIISAEFCPLRYHLVVARYDRNIVSSQDVLKSFNSLNVNARLIGPI
ncbi:MAG: hypothetical protein PVJ15_02645 [Gammaproteobacteria bacterium]|jgi:hypothetical protein